MTPAPDALPGFGIWHYTPLNSEACGVFASYAIVLVDAKTLKPHWAALGIASPVHPTRVIYRDVPAATCPAKPELSPDQAATVKQALDEELADSIPETMLHMALTGMMGSGDPPPAPSPPASPVQAPSR
ncbi:MAG TPA: hypothetical protein VGF56_12325 [Rhizomicrobium sp.]